MNAATTKAQGHSTSRSENRNAKFALLSRDVRRQNERELESHAAGFLADRLGVNARAEAEGNDADGRFSGLVFCGADGHVELDELKRLGPAPDLSEREFPGMLRDAGERRADAWNFLCGVLHAFVNFGQGFGYEVAEVHG